MGFKTFTAAVLTAADVNNYLMKQAVISCTAATRPTAVEGMVIYETDTDKLQVYDGATWQQVWPIQSGARGLLGLKKLTADHSGFSAETTINADGSSTRELSWTADTARAYRITGWARLDAAGSDGERHLRITDGSNNMKEQSYAYIQVGGNPHHGWVQEIINGGVSGTTTRRLRAYAQFGTCTVSAASTRPAWFMVEDIGTSV